MHQLSPNTKTTLLAFDYKSFKNMKNLRLRIFIETRLHSVILASLAGILTILISYQHFKAHGISKQLKIDESLINIEDVQPKLLISRTVKLLEKYGETQDRVVTAVRKIRSSMTSKVSFILSSFLK
jgi:polysaccharide pyruvyl transferase WcaK-like protein